MSKFLRHFFLLASFTLVALTVLNACSSTRGWRTVYRRDAVDRIK